MWSVLLNRVESRNISQEIKVNLIFVHAAELIQNSKGNVSDVDSLLQDFEKFENFNRTRLFNNLSKRAILSLSFYVIEKVHYWDSYTIDGLNYFHLHSGTNYGSNNIFLMKIENATTSTYFWHLIYCFVNRILSVR